MVGVRIESTESMPEQVGASGVDWVIHLNWLVELCLDHPGLFAARAG